MLYVPNMPSASAGVHVGKTVTGQQRRALRKLLRDLVCFAGVAAADLAAASRKAPQRNRHRLLYRNANSLTDTDIDRLVDEIGAARLMAALDRYTRPQLPLQAVE